MRKKHSIYPKNDNVKDGLGAVALICMLTVFTTLFVLLSNL